MSSNLGRRLVSAIATVAALSWIAVAAAPAAWAHPLGNFTVNYYSGIQVEPHKVQIALVVDRAEIPTLQAFPDAKAGRQPVGADTWRTSQCALLASEATLKIDGTRLPLSVTASRLKLLAGAAGLATSRLECTVSTNRTLNTVSHSVTYLAATTSGRVGWHEITAVGNGTTLAGSDVPTSSVSNELTRYPQDLLTSPLDQRTAHFEVRVGSGLVATEAAARVLSTSPLRGLDRFTRTYTNLVSRTHLTPAFALLAILLSMLLGGLHAFAPGHGKTLMAAYLVGREGTWRQAAVIGVSVTVTHTIGVLLLGVALSAAALAAPERVYPWLGLLSGILLAGIGLTLLRSTRTNHGHGPDGHTHGPSGHTHEPHHHDDAGHTHQLGDHEHEGPTVPAPRRHRSGNLRLAAVGLAGGLVPSPSALLVLLGGIAIGRAWFGAILVLFYGIGMAASLVGTGLLLVHARDRFERWNARRPESRTLPGQVLALRVSRALPMLTAVAVFGVGAWIAFRSLLTI
jgi:nickel/cobalt exporter